MLHDEKRLDRRTEAIWAAYRRFDAIEIPLCHACAISAVPSIPNGYSQLPKSYWTNEPVLQHCASKNGIP